MVVAYQEGWGLVRESDLASRERGVGWVVFG